LARMQDNLTKILEEGSEDKTIPILLRNWPVDPEPVSAHEWLAESYRSLAIEEHRNMCKASADYDEAKAEHFSAYSQHYLRQAANHEWWCRQYQETRRKP
jgi:predicted RNA polymerase sigma factor